jgi:hypothetical protein
MTGGRASTVSSTEALSADTPTRGYTVASLCKRWRIGADKVRTFIRRGELVAVNVALNPCGKPQWRITPESVELFEQRRTSVLTPKPQRRRRRGPEIDFYPD